MVDEVTQNEISEYRLSWSFKPDFALHLETPWLLQPRIVRISHGLLATLDVRVVRLKQVIL